MKMFEANLGTTLSSVLRGHVDLVDRLAQDWLSLLVRSSRNEPFYGPEWVGAYIRAFTPPGQLLLVTAQTEGRLDAILPLMEQKTLFCGIPVRKLTSANNVHCCRFDLVRCAGPAGEHAVKAVWKCLRELSNWDVIELLDVPEGGSAELLLEAAAKDGFLTGKWESIRSPFVPLSGVGAAGAVPKSSHFRQNLRRRIRKAEALGPRRLSRFDRADPVALERLFDLEKSGWKGRTGTAMASADATRRFYTEIAHAAERLGYLSLYLLEFGQTLVAGHYGLTYKGRYYTPKVAYAESYAVYGPGHIMVDAVLRDCVQRGLHEFDFLGPRMDFKMEWASEERAHSNCYVFRAGLFGQTLYSAKFRVMAALRKAARSPAGAALRRRLGV
jgi:CelD/BcsL family acetyltransferase involved in cellulose biosynthesis